MYVLFEGIDGVGKSTQIEILASKFSDAIVTKEPGGTQLGVNLREILLSSNVKIGKRAEFLLFLALLLIYILSQMIRQILQPKIIGDAVGLPPLLALIFLFLGYKLYGISGMVLALPVGMLLVRFYHYGAFSGFFSAGKTLGKMLLDYAGVKKDEEV